MFGTTRISTEGPTTAPKTPNGRPCVRAGKHDARAGKIPPSTGSRSPSPLYGAGNGWFKVLRASLALSMDALPCGCGPSSIPPYVRFCARHDPARVKALEQLSHDILAKAQEVYGKLDSSSGVFLPQYTRISAADEMQDLLEEFVPQFQKLMAYRSPLPSGETTTPSERPP